MLVVESVGLQCTVQDLGRPGLAHLGVSRSGAADAGSLRLANRLVGNPEHRAGLECTLLGLSVRLSGGRWIAVTGAECELRIGGRPAATHRPQYAGAGELVEIGRASRGLRAYLGVAGGVAVPEVLGSRSTDTLSGIGPEPLQPGDVLPLGTDLAPPAAVDLAVQPPVTDELDVRITLGPRHEMFEPEALNTLVGHAYRVTGDTDRIGARLEGPPLGGRIEQLPSEGMPLGAVQVPAGGRPIVFLADHPTTGGYPVIAVVHPGDLRLIAQAAPDTRIRFHRHRRA